MNKNNLNNILQLLKQVGGPVKITYQTKQITLISDDIINYHIDKIINLINSNKIFVDEYNISDIYSLYGCINYIITDLGEDEFDTVLGKDLYLDGYKLLIDIKNYLI